MNNIDVYIELFNSIKLAAAVLSMALGMKNITFKQIRAFATVARERNFTRAAESLHVTQSTLTSAIKLLEAEIGLPLFDRSTRTLALTPQGERFLPRAQRLLEELEDSLDDLAGLATGQWGYVTVAGAASFIQYVLAPAVAVLAKKHPGIAVRLSEDTTEVATRKVLASEADFGVVTLTEKVPQLESIKLLTDRYGVVFPRHHPLDKKREPITWAELQEHTVIGLHPNNGIRSLIDRQADIPGSLKRPAYEINAMPSLLPLLEQKIGCAALPSMAAAPLVAAGMQFKRLTQPDLYRQLHVFKKKNRSLTPSALALLQATAESLQRLRANRDIHVHATETTLQVFGEA